ncbi:DDE superfamily endonuclease-domain-containing protein [Lentinula raphanica]|nr:DDE superfamily endonuclease-domain-containing protein [Lentinula raphanica]KAJ3746876.1 DDE superfamily endonuclease-domain-containing protein [Lentinula raphanica]
MARRSHPVLRTIIASRRSRSTSLADGPGFLYAFIDNGYRYKIGMTNNFARRQKQWDRQCPCSNRDWMPPIAVRRRRRAEAAVGLSQDDSIQDQKYEDYGTHAGLITVAGIHKDELEAIDTRLTSSFLKGNLFIEISHVTLNLFRASHPANADGSEKGQAFIIGKAKKSRAFGNKEGWQLGFYYRNNAKAWMTISLYQDWLLEWEQKLIQHKRKILLLQDNCTAHKPPEGLQNIAVENIHPNLTSHIQPNDAGIIRCFKAHYRRHYIQRAIDRYDSGITPAEIYDINQLEAMRLAEKAWKEVEASTIAHCWRKTGILPTSESTNPSSGAVSVPIASLVHETSHDPIQIAEQEVEDALDGLVNTGALQHVNRMSIDALLNPKKEAHFMMHETSDQEIFDAVMDAHAAQDNGEINGGDDDKDDDAPVPVRPSRRQALHAATTLKDYVSCFVWPSNSFGGKLSYGRYSVDRLLQTCLESALCFGST